MTEPKQLTLDEWKQKTEAEILALMEGKSRDELAEIAGALGLTKRGKKDEIKARLLEPIRAATAPTNSTPPASDEELTDAEREALSDEPQPSPPAAGAAPAPQQAAPQPQPAQAAPAPDPTRDIPTRHIEALTRPNRPGLTPIAASPYWIGSLEGGPQDDYIFGGHLFPRITKTVTNPEQMIGPLEFRTNVGCCVWLLPDQVELIRRDIAKFVVRRAGAVALQGRLHMQGDHQVIHQDGVTVRTERYYETPRDYSVACHVYLRPWAEKIQHCFEGRLVRLPRTVAQDLDIEIPDWVFGELRMQEEEKLRLERISGEDTLEDEWGPSIEEAKRFLAARNARQSIYSG